MQAINQIDYLQDIAINQETNELTISNETCDYPERKEEVLEDTIEYMLKKLAYVFELEEDDAIPRGDNKPHIKLFYLRRRIPYNLLLFIAIYCLLILILPLIQLITMS